MMKPRVLLLVGVLSAAFSAEPARAALILDVAGTSVAPGGTGLVSVWLSSDAPDTAADLLNNFGVQVLITTSGATRLEFTTVQPEAFLGDRAYVFSLDSFDQDSLTAPSSIGTTFLPGDTVNASDSTTSGNPVALSVSSGQKLLAQFRVTARTSLPPEIGDTFTLRLVPDAGMGSLADSTATYFDVYDFGLGMERSAVTYRSMPGTVSVSPVPEPSTFVLMAGGLAGLLVVGRRRSA